ncbi:MAG: GNAT family N-acetyltransferase, partial [Pirellulaceae bacterium]
GFFGFLCRVMGVTYFKRYRLEYALTGSSFASPPLPPHYSVLPWDPALLDCHADAKYRSFCGEIDANVFPCLGEREGCRRLMEEITRRDTFLPGATWLLAYQPPGQSAPEFCGTIQGLRDRQGYGAVQNLGVTPLHRSQGLGTSLLAQALSGFRAEGLRRAYLEVTAQNTGAIRLYTHLGFRQVRTVYKAVEVAYV